MRPHTSMYVGIILLLSSCHYICVFLLLLTCPHTPIYLASSYSYICVLMHSPSRRFVTTPANLRKTNVCWHMLTYADECGRMLAYAPQACSQQALPPANVRKTNVCWHMLTYADECWRMRTNAGVCTSGMFTAGITTPADVIKTNVQTYNARVARLAARYSLYLLYWYKSTHT
jgi:hypothetical protein